MRRRFLLLASSVVLFISSFQALAAQVEGVQTPAWLERAGQRQPLRPGMTLTEADVVETGHGGRLFLQLADGSFVKLGEEARLALDSLQEDAARSSAISRCASPPPPSASAVPMSGARAGTGARPCA
jgi:hypothetical protein